MKILPKQATTTCANCLHVAPRIGLLEVNRSETVTDLYCVPVVAFSFPVQIRDERSTNSSRAGQPLGKFKYPGQRECARTFRPWQRQQPAQSTQSIRRAHSEQRR